MKHTIDIQNVCNSENLPTEEHFQQWIDAVFTILINKDFELTIRLVNIEESQQLNKQYRNLNKPTNVLSFPFDVPEGIDLNLLGDLVICSQIVEEEAIAQNKALFDHWAHMVIHGCLHLLGYDHINDIDADEMESIEVNILDKLTIADPYKL